MSAFDLAACITSAGTLAGPGGDLLARWSDRRQLFYLKEDLRQFWEQADRRSTERFLTRWIRKAPTK